MWSVATAVNWFIKRSLLFLSSIGETKRRDRSALRPDKSVPISHFLFHQPTIIIYAFYNPRSCLTIVFMFWLIRFVWEFNGNETIHCPNKTVSKFFSSPNPDPGHLVKLSMFNQQGDMASLEKNIKIYDAIEKPIRVSYPNRTRSYELTEFVVEPHKGHGVR